MSLHKELLKASNPLQPFGERTDVLPYYAFVSKALEKFAHDNEIAVKNHLSEKQALLKRGSFHGKLTANNVAGLFDEKMWRARKEIGKLAEAKKLLSKKQQLLWQYFLPHHYAEYLYSTNTEKPHAAISRIFFDIDRAKGMPLEAARQAALGLWDAIEEDREFEALAGVKERFFLWTGNSFHLYVSIEKQLQHSFYEKWLSAESDASFVKKWVKQINEAGKVRVAEAHERKPGFINIDPSHTPGGKLARMPFSLHLSNLAIDGACLPIGKKHLEKPSELEKIGKISIRGLIKDFRDWAKRLPKV